MRIDTPRLVPLTDDALDADTRKRFGDGPILNIFRTIAHHPKLLKRWLVFGNHVLQKSSLDEREREILILRIGWLCRAGYEWGQHVVIAKRSGLDDTEIERIADGPDAEGWRPHERALLRATDELHADAFVSDATWRELAEYHDEEQLLDILFTVGQYNMVSMVLNSLGVQPEPGAPTLPQR
ncbi:MAG: carboxymuconolactone decarboxylase family protein [Deltaproteobacteria bacterium]|nr:carboxymuconolactone decarboxylase family protein [Deltaproteobacteria bacterium]